MPSELKIVTAKGGHSKRYALDIMTTEKTGRCGRLDNYRFAELDLLSKWIVAHPRIQVRKDGAGNLANIIRLEVIASNKPKDVGKEFGRAPIPSPFGDG